MGWALQQRELPCRGLSWAACKQQSQGVGVLTRRRIALRTCRKINSAHNGRKLEAIAYYRIESAVALFCALLINIFVVSVFARCAPPEAAETLCCCCWCSSCAPWHFCVLRHL